MAIDTLWIVLMYLKDSSNDNGGMFTIDSHVARQLINSVNRKSGFMYELPYPISRDGHHEFLLPGGAKVGRYCGEYYVKSYSKFDISRLMTYLYE